MRTGAFLLGVALCLGGRAQVRINEVQAARSSGSTGLGADGDWIELYNAGSKAVDLQGSTLVLGPLLHRFQAQLVLPAKSCRVLWCDGRTEEGVDHVAFDLPRTGGTLLLIAADHTTVEDLFHWPVLPPGVSLGRTADGGRSWGFFNAPTPGAANAGSIAASACLDLPVVTEQADGRIRIDVPANTEVHYTTGNTPPSLLSLRYTSPLALPRGTVLRAKAFAPDALPSPCAVHVAQLPTGAMSLVLAPEDLHGPRGIADTTNANFARKGPDWQRPAWMQYGADTALRIGLAIAGSGSRGLPKKNFKLLARDRFGSCGPFTLPGLGSWSSWFLRADATPQAFLRNLFMEEVVRRSGGRVDMQRSRAVPLYLNGSYQGLYRAMPAKGKEWVEALNGGGAVDVVEGPAGRSVTGDRKSYLRLLQCLDRAAPVDSLTALADLKSLIDLACFDLWTGRADHGLNVRCWRPATADGRWRWVLYDMDLWAPADDHTMARMCGEAVPETPWLPRLLAEPALRERLLARLSALLATTLSPDRALPLADSLYRSHAAEMAHDHERWKDLMASPAPGECLAGLEDHIRRRAGILLKQVAQYTGTTTTGFQVQVEPPQAGTVLVEGLPFTGDARSMQRFSNVPLRLTAVAAAGMVFAGWTGINADRAEALVEGRQAITIKAVFRPVGLSSQGRLKQ